MNQFSTSACVLAFDDEREFACELARSLNISIEFVECHRFPDGELKLRLPPTLPERVFMLRSLPQPNEKLVELLIAAPTARELGAHQLVLVCPYLAYMRQDIEFAPGEAVSQRHIAGLLASRFDQIITIDPHLHRISSLQSVMPGCRAISLSAAASIGIWVSQQLDRALLLGPDEESAQWVREAARACDPMVDYGWCLKQRHGDHDVTVTLPPALKLQGRHVVLIDDLVSTGRTIAAAARLALAAGALSVDVAVTHALFVGDAQAQLKSVGIGHIWSTDCVPHESNVISVVPLLAKALRQ